MTRRITDVVAALARRTPNDHAIIDIREHGVAVWTWEKLWRESSRIAALLLRLGVEPGEVVAYQLPNSREFVAVTLAALRIGAVCCPLPAIFREHELTFVLSRSRARVVFAADVFRGRHHALEIASLEGQLPLLQHLIVVKENDQRGALPVTRRITCVRLYRAVRSASLNLTEIDQRRPAEDFPAQLLFTSGTSGVPKGVIHRHDVLMNAATLHVAQLGLDTGDRIFVPSPLAHQTGFLYGMWVAWLLGVPQILQAVWDPGRAVRMLREWHGTFTQAAPTFLADLVRTVQAGVRAPSTLRLFVPTGATVPRTLAQEAERVLHCQICGA
ncbi:MAG TPA: AMP-binding protein, partial [Steroidobacteraceae bacterium]|nr:AMP-binding protein [Steroidobacteraceae bacterium]